MHCELTEEHRELRASVRKFAEKELTPIAETIDREQTFPCDVLRKAGALGLIGSYLPEKYGGGGGDFLGKCLIAEELARASAGFEMSLDVSGVIFANPIFRFGTEEQKQKYLPRVLSGEKIGAWALTEPEAGSDALSIRTQSRREGNGYVINGAKMFITNAPIADFFVVLTRTYGKGIEGGTAFILERGQEGLSTSSAFDKMGHRCSPTGEIVLTDVRVPASQRLGEEGRAFVDAFGSLDVERTLGPFNYLGIAQACLDAAVQYARQRIQFGQPIGNFQLVQSRLAQMATGIDIARSYAYRCAWLVDRKRAVHKEASIAKLFSSRIAVECADHAMQIYGGSGYLSGSGVERYYRDAKLSEIGAGTSEIQQLIIARELLK